MNLELEFAIGDFIIDHDCRNFEVLKITIEIDEFEIVGIYHCIDNDMDSEQFTFDDDRIYRG